MSIRLVKCLPKVGFKNDFLHVSFPQYFLALLKIIYKKCLRKPCLPSDRVWQNSSFLPNLFCMASNQYVNEVSVVLQHDIRELKIRRLRTTATVKHATAHDQNHVTVHFSRVVLRLRWVVELFRVVGTTENILLVFCRLGSSRISPFRKKVFNSPALSERKAKYVSCV